MHLELPVPNYTTLSRRAAGLVVQLPKQDRGSLHLAVDKTSGEIQAMVLSPLELDDAGAVEELLAATSASIQQLSGDGSYDKRKVYAWAAEQGVKHFAIPPQKGARHWRTTWSQSSSAQTAIHPRDQTQAWIRQIGRRKWKRASGYYRQSIAENAIYRFKTLCSSKLRSRKLPQQITEARIKCVILNRMAHLGMPDSYPVLAV